MHQVSKNRTKWAIGRLSDTVLILGSSLILFVAVLVFVAMTPTAIWLAFNGISPLWPKVVYTTASPDNMHEIKVTKQVHLPVFDLLDEPTTIAVELREVRSQGVLDSVRFEISDICHLNNPKVEWDVRRVVVENVDTQTKRDIAFDLPDHIAELR